MAKVYVDKDKGGLDAALRDFKRQVKKSGILIECRKRKYFMTPAEKRKFKAQNKFKKK